MNPYNTSIQVTETGRAFTAVTAKGSSTPKVIFEGIVSEETARKVYLKESASKN